MQIIQNLLYSNDQQPCAYVQSPNHGGPLQPKWLVMHYTAMGGMDKALQRLTDQQSEVSAHLLIGRGGELVQMLPFNVVAWHAGVSEWNGLSNLNKYSIGIELDNAGWLTQENGRYFSWEGNEYPPEEVYHHQQQRQEEKAYWHAYSEVQLEVALKVANLLVKQYGIEGVLAHQDIAPSRKTDPGPAFPMEAFRRQLF